MKLLNETTLKTVRNSEILDTHPCFSMEAHHNFGRVHLPVAPACNVQCKYCVRKFDCANESRPGITSRVMNAYEAMERVRAVVSGNENISVIGIAGPGDPLANDATFDTLHAIHKEFPELILCVSTNGLNLPERLEELMKAGVRSLTVTINAVTPVMAEKIYSWASFKGRRYAGRDAATLIVNNQWRGLTNAIDAGLIVRVNTVFIPGVNDVEIPLIAWHAGERGADIMHIKPLLPQAEFEGRERPSHDMMVKKQAECERYMPQMTLYRQCRLDACGLPSEEKEMELEGLHPGTRVECCEMV
jgi:nitrogen fixation protein NifB